MPNLELSRVSKVRRGGAHFLGGAYINFEVNIRVLPLGLLAPALIHPSDCRGHRLSYNSATDRHQVVPALFCLLSPAYFLGASGSFFSAALAAGFGCSAFAFGSLKNDFIFPSTVIVYLLYSCEPPYSKTKIHQQRQV